MIVENKCRDYGERESCLGDPDPNYTMDFSDIGEGQIYWCSSCGPEAQELNVLLVSALRTGMITPQQLDSAITEAEQMEKKN